MAKAPRKKRHRNVFALRAALSAIGLSQRQLALRLGVGENYVSRLAAGRGTPSWETACRIADAAGVSLDAFRLPPDEDPTRKPKKRKRTQAAAARGRAETGEGG